MTTDLKVLLVDDDRDFCEDFEKCFAGIDGIELACSTGSATEAIEYVKKNQPDAVILDLELHSGEGNGIMFLSQLNHLSGIRRPYVMINTNNSSITTYKIVRKLGADFVMYKHQQGYCAQEVADFLLAVGTCGYEDPKDPPHSEQNSDVPSDLKARIYAELNSITVNPRSKGYHYLADAIEIGCQGQLANISSIVAERYGKTRPSVERAMQNAIDKAWNTADIDDLDEHYTAYINPKREAPTVMEFVSYFAGKFRSNNTK